MEETIKNLDVYNNGMAKSLQDKLFFLPIIGDRISTFTDFGCADGTLLEAIYNYDNKIGLYGVDSNTDMLALTEERVPKANLICDKIPPSSRLGLSGHVLNLSSVLHEVNSYCTEDEKEEFWNSLNNGDYGYITIRDMIYNGADDESCCFLYPHTIKEIGDGKFGDIYEFEEIWGSITNKKNLMHYLLKYRYIQNWKREVKENYLGYSTDDIINHIDSEKYELIYRKDYILPFLKNRIHDDFNIWINTPTHTNLIFKRR